MKNAPCVGRAQLTSQALVDDVKWDYMEFN